MWLKFVINCFIVFLEFIGKINRGKFWLFVYCSGSLVFFVFGFFLIRSGIFKVCVIWKVWVSFGLYRYWLELVYSDVSVISDLS